VTPDFIGAQLWVNLESENQWFVVADCDLSTDPGVPFLISSNLRPSFTNVSQAARMFFHRDFT